MINQIISGILHISGETSFIEDNSGVRHLENNLIWKGYLKHWNGKNVHARLLDKHDYTTGNRIIIIWPDEPSPSPDFFELYYNERLVKYPVSLCGHNAINVSGRIFNFSHLINENEIMTPEEYFYRPALGEFAPSPFTGKTDLTDPEHPYFDKFGRSFMRTIHVLRVEGIDSGRLDAILREKLEHILHLTPDPERPGENPEFHWRRNNCTTNIADALKESGLDRVTGSFPRDLFVSAAYACIRTYGKGRVKIYRRPQLVVDEAPLSKITPMINPLNYLKLLHLKFIC